MVIARSSPKLKKCKTRQKRKRSSSLSSLSSSDSASSRSFSLSPTPKKPSLQEKKSNRVRCTKKKKNSQSKEKFCSRGENFLSGGSSLRNIQDSYQTRPTKGESTNGGSGFVNIEKCSTFILEKRY